MNTDHKLAELIRVSSHVVHELISGYYIRQATDIPISANQFSILRILSITRPYTLSEIANVLQISNAATGKNIDKLVQFKLVTRRLRRSDRRKASIAITDGGEQILNQYDIVREEYQTKTMAEFTEEEKMTFSALLRRFIINTFPDQQNSSLICLQCNKKCWEECIVREIEGKCNYNLFTE